jgi:hypothetical protein
MTSDVGSSQLLEFAFWALWVTAVLRNILSKDPKGLAPATLEFWVRFPNERNRSQGKQAHPVLKYLVSHGPRTAL